VDGVSLQVHAGEIVGLLGPNGAGKTTTFQAITGGLEAKGEVFLEGIPLEGPLHVRARRGLGYLPQAPTLISGLSARRHLHLALEARGAPLGEAQDLLEKLGIGDCGDRTPRQMSGGEQRRLEVARCLAVGARVLLLDEPFAGLDPLIVKELGGLFRGLAQEGLGVLLTDHAVREALALCDRVLLMDTGRIVLAGSAAEVAEDPVARDRWLGEGFTFVDPRTNAIEGQS
jgi:lipopolysaccharide export system ATP-binding protein